AAPLRPALPVAHTGGVLPRPVRVLLPRPAAGHPWPAVRTPPVHGTGRDAFLLRFEDQGRGALAPVLVGMGVAAAAAVPRGPLTIQPVSTSTRRWLRFRPRHRSGSAVEAGGMPRAGHGWPAAGTGSRMRIFRLGIPPASTAGSARTPGAINRKPPLSREKSQEVSRAPESSVVDAPILRRRRRPGS